MNVFYLRNICNNKLSFTILLVLLSLLSVCMPHGVIETHEHQDFKSMFMQVANNHRHLTKTRKFFENFKVYILRNSKIIFTIPQNIKARFVLFNLLFFKLSIHQLYSFLYCYFHASKYKEARG